MPCMEQDSSIRAHQSYSDYRESTSLHHRRASMFQLVLIQGSQGLVCLHGMDGQASDPSYIHIHVMHRGPRGVACTALTSLRELLSIESASLEP